ISTTPSWPCRPIWAMPRSATPTGISLASPNCSTWPPLGSSASVPPTLEPPYDHDDRSPRFRHARPGILLWTAHRPAEREHPDGDLVQGYLPPPAELLRRIPRPASDGADLGGPGCPDGPGLPGPPGAPARQLCPHPKRALGGPALVLEVRRHPRPGQ